MRTVFILTFILIILLIALVGYWVLKGTEPKNIMNPEKNQNNLSAAKNPVATLETTKGVIKIELFIDKTPITAGNFVKLAKSGFYDGIKFHRVIKDFMIQSGDPNSKESDASKYGLGGPGYNIQDEFVSGLSNVRGTISMANIGQPNTGGSQFFINLVDNTGLDFDKPPLTSRHPVFGKVIEGMDVVDAIANSKTNASDLPTEPVIINKIAITE